MPKARPLVAFTGVVIGPVTSTFKVYVPDSRLRVKISVMFVPRAGLDPITFLTSTATLWLSALEMDESGVSGTDVPCTNLEGTSAAPTAISAANGLYGYSKEFTTASDAIRGVLAATGSINTIGTWMIQVRYQPIGVSFSDAEWRELRTRMGVEVQGAAVAAPCEDCTTTDFPGPYQSTLPGSNGRITTILDLGYMDWSCFTPGNDLTWQATVTFESPAGWALFSAQGTAAIYLGGLGIIGDIDPPTDITAGADGANVNILLTDPGPAGATTVVVFGPVTVGTVPATPGNHIPIKLVLSSNKAANPSFSYITKVLSASFKICDHVFE